MRKERETAGGSNCQPIIYTIDEVKKHLHPDLVPFYEKESPECCFPVIRHPLVYVVPFWHTKYEVDRVNESYKVKTEWIQRHMDEGDYRAAIFLYERPYRFSALLPLKYDKRVTSGEFWRLAGHVWVDSENIHENIWSWVNLFSGRAQEETLQMMNEDERKAFDKLPDELTIYRGTSYGSDPGLSYTLKKERADWFSTRFEMFAKNQKLGSAKKTWCPVVVKRTIHKKDVVAHFTYRNEYEIVIRPELMLSVDEHEVA